MTGEDVSRETAPLKGYRLRAAEPGPAAVSHDRIFADMLVAEPPPLRGSARPRLAPALALVLRADVPGGAEREAVQVAIGGAFLALELRADDARAGAFVVGEHLLPVPFDGSLRLYLGGRLAAEAPVEALGAPTERLARLAAEVGGLRAGQFVLLTAAAHEARPGTVELWGPGGSTLVTAFDEAEN